MKRVKVSELNQVSGGVVVYDSGSYWAVSDDGMFMCSDAFRSKEDAQKQCIEWGWEPDFVSKKEFEERVGFPFDLYDFY